MNIQMIVLTEERVPKNKQQQQNYLVTMFSVEANSRKNRLTYIDRKMVIC